MSFSGIQLKERNEKICHCIRELKAQRNELNFLIEKQQEEKIKLQTEVERITYKLSLINKSVSQRIITRTNYDRTIKHAEEGYYKLVQSSGVLLDTVQKDANELEQSMDKKVGTEVISADTEEENISREIASGDVKENIDSVDD